MWVLSAVVALVLAATTPLATVGPDSWACAPRMRHGFTTDPVVHPPHAALAEIVAAMPVSGSGSFAIEERGQAATVIRRDAAGLIVTRLVFSRGVDSGWQLERSRSCARTPHW